MAFNEPLVPILLEDITEPQVVVPLALQPRKIGRPPGIKNMVDFLNIGYN